MGIRRLGRPVGFNYPTGLTASSNTTAFAFAWFLK